MSPEYKDRAGLEVREYKDCAGLEVREYKDSAGLEVVPGDGLVVQIITLGLVLNLCGFRIILINTLRMNLYSRPQIAP